MSEQNRPEIVTFQMQHDEFLFLGIENPRNSDMGKVWDNFGKMGGWDMNTKYHKKPYGTMMVVWQYNNPENEIYFPGTIVENVDKVPEGFALKKFPACEFLVITTEWVPPHESLWRENGSAWTSIDNKDNTRLIPNGYERYGGPDNQITLVERENHDAEKGSRYEIWVPIKKEAK